MLKIRICNWRECCVEYLEHVTETVWNFGAHVFTWMIRNIWLNVTS